MSVKNDRLARKSANEQLLDRFHPIDGNAFLLETPHEFRFEQALAYLSRSANEALFRIDEQKRTITRCMPVGEHKPIVSIGSEPGGRLIVHITGFEPSSLSTVQSAVAREIAEWFDLDTDLAPFYAMAARDPLLSGPSELFYGLRLIGVTDLFEAVGWAILGQQINLTFAYKLKRRLVETYGDFATDSSGERHWIFPSASRIASLQPADLTALQLTGKKAEYLIETATRIAEGSLTKEILLVPGKVEAADRTLTAIRGIGPWTAHYVAMRCLRYRNAFPIQDVGLHLAIQKLLGSDRKPSLAEIRSFSANWSGWESYATFYLWRTLY